VQGPTLSDELAGRVLSRLGVEPGTTAEGLAAVYRAWCSAVPWDNVQKRITVAERRPILAGADPVEFFENFLAHGTGGTCWPSSGALHALLATLGFDGRRAVAAMQYDRFGKSPNHGTEIVRVDGEEWLVDSSMLSGRPVPLRHGDVTEVRDALHPLRAEPNDDGMWLVTWASYARDEPITCWIYEDDVTHERFLERYEASRVSGFSYGLTFRRNRPDGILSVQGHTRRFKDASGQIESTEVADRGSVLVYEGGLSPEIVSRLPDDEPAPGR
jgi:arylamine N-acetyltransferase